MGLSEAEELELLELEEAEFQQQKALSLPPLAPAEPKENVAVSAIRNLAQGATANFSDEIAGAGEVAGRAVGLEGLGGPMRDIKLAKDGPTLDWEILRDAYSRATKKEREAIKKDLKDNPAVSVGANLVGAVVSPLGKAKALQGASALKTGAALGGAAAAGASEAETIGGLASDTAIGLVGGAALGKLADKVGPTLERGVQKVGKATKEFAKDRAAAALGATKALRKGIGAKKVLDAADDALEQGVITPLSGPDRMLERAKALRAKGGKQMGEVYDKIDDAGAGTFNPLEVASKVDEKIGDFYRSPINRGETNQLENTLESIVMRGDKNITMREAQTLKEEIGKVANWKNKVSVTDKEKMARDDYAIVNKAIDDAADAGSEKLGIQGLKEILQSGKKASQTGRVAENLLEEKIAQRGNNIVGLTDFITAGGGAAYGGDWESGLVAVAAKKGAQRFGNQMLSTGGNAIAKKLLASPKMLSLYQKNPQAFQNIVTQVENKAGAFAPSGLPKAASNPGELDNDSGIPAQEPAKEREPDSSSKPLKGRDKWANDGLKKVATHLGEPDLVNRASLLSDPKMKELLIQASDLSPKSKAMEKITTKIKNRLAKERS